MHKLLIVPVLFLTFPVTAATKTNVEQLQSLLSELYQQKKSDEVTANRLKEITLTEQLTPAAVERLNQYPAGPLTAVQIRILATESALLPPPTSDLPSDPAPDRAVQAAMIGRMVDFILHRYSQMPALAAEKEIVRYQNGDVHAPGGSGSYGQFYTADLNGDVKNPYLSMVDDYTTTVRSQNGIELPPSSPNKSDSAHNPQTLPLAPATILIDAAKSDLHFLRWEFIEGKKTAVFGFDADPKVSHYNVKYCCFPVDAEVNAGHIRGISSGTAVDFKPFTATRSYRGEFFVDPATGTLLRLMTWAKFKPTDFVRQEDVRIDYASVQLGGQQYIVPLKCVILTQVFPNGDASVRPVIQRVLFNITYSSYKTVSAVSGKNF